MGRGWKWTELWPSTAPVPYPTKSYKRAARSGDRSHQLQSFLGEPVPGSAHSSGLRSHAGVTLAGCWDSLCSSSSLHAARTVAQAWSTSDGFGTTCSCSPTGVVSVSAQLRPHRHKFPSSERIVPHFSPSQNKLVALWGKVCRSATKFVFRSA